MEEISYWCNSIPYREISGHGRVQADSYLAEVFNEVIFGMEVSVKGPCEQHVQCFAPQSRAIKWRGGGVDSNPNQGWGIGKVIQGAMENSMK